MKHKTQVFVSDEGDHYRTRLTHSLEVSNIARSICRSLGLNEELAETLALAHDLGHTPFGHAGENALNDCMADHGGFDHNAQTLRILTRLERKYAEFDGLNLTWETLEGVVKHNGPLVRAAKDRPRAAPIAEDSEYLRSTTWRSILARNWRAQSRRWRTISPITTTIWTRFARGVVLHREVRAVRFVRRGIPRFWTAIPIWKSRASTTRRNRGDSLMVDACWPRPAAAIPFRTGHPDAVRRRGRCDGYLFEAMAATTAPWGLPVRNMYKHPQVTRMTAGAGYRAQLFGLFFDEPEALPSPWRHRAGRASRRRARVIADYIAGMTDRLPMNEQTADRRRTLTDRA